MATVKHYTAYIVSEEQLDLNVPMLREGLIRWISKRGLTT